MHTAGPQCACVYACAQLDFAFTISSLPLQGFTQKRRQKHEANGWSFARSHVVQTLSQEDVGVMLCPSSLLLLLLFLTVRDMR